VADAADGTVRLHSISESLQSGRRRSSTCSTSTAWRRERQVAIEHTDDGVVLVRDGRRVTLSPDAARLVYVAEE
jgi:hypothetical protein